MKSMMKPVDMLAWFDAEGNPHPVRFRLQNPEGENIIIRIGRVSNTAYENSGGNAMLRFECSATLDGAVRFVRLRYELGSCKWYLAGI